MSDVVSFWMENKSCVGKLALTIGDQSLVIYRERYYLLKGGTAETRGGKPLRYSLSSLPATWKLALKGGLQALPAAAQAEPDSDPVAMIPKRPRVKKEQLIVPEPQLETVPVEIEEVPLKAAKPAKRADKPAPQEPVIANCPNCSSRHEIPLEKGKSGKPFFITCNKCTSEFAVRFVQVTMFQAQVAGFK